VDELRRLATFIRVIAERELSAYYPMRPDGGKPIAYIWARTATCDNCGADIPLVHSFWLSTRGRSKAALRYKVQKSNNPPTVHFEIFVPTDDRQVPSPTVSRANAICPACNTVLPAGRVRVQLAKRRGGTDDARMLAVVVTYPNQQGRAYRL